MISLSLYLLIGVITVFIPFIIVKKYKLFGNPFDHMFHEDASTDDDLLSSFTIFVATFLWWIPVSCLILYWGSKALAKGIRMITKDKKVNT